MLDGLSPQGVESLWDAGESPEPTPSSPCDKLMPCVSCARGLVRLTLQAEEVPDRLNLAKDKAVSFT